MRIFIFLGSRFRENDKKDSGNDKKGIGDIYNRLFKPGKTYLVIPDPVSSMGQALAGNNVPVRIFL